MPLPFLILVGYRLASCSFFVHFQFVPLSHRFFQSSFHLPLFFFISFRLSFITSLLTSFSCFPSIYVLPLIISFILFSDFSSLSFNFSSIILLISSCSTFTFFISRFMLSMVDFISLTYVSIFWNTSIIISFTCSTTFFSISFTFPVMLFSTFSTNRSFISFIYFLTITIVFSTLSNFATKSISLHSLQIQLNGECFFSKTLFSSLVIFSHLLCAHTLHTSHSSPMSLVSILSLQVLHTSLLSTNHTFSMGLSCHPPPRSSLFFVGLYWCLCNGDIALQLATLSLFVFFFFNLCHLHFNIAPSALFFYHSAVA